MTMDRKQVVEALRLMAKNVTETSPAGLIAELLQLAKEVEGKEQSPATPATPPAAPARVSSKKQREFYTPDAPEVAGMLQELIALFEGGRLSGKCASFTETFLANTRFSVEGLQTALVRARKNGAAPSRGNGKGPSTELPPSRGNDDMPF